MKNDKTSNWSFPEKVSTFSEQQNQYWKLFQNAMHQYRVLPILINSNNKNQYSATKLNLVPVSSLFAFTKKYFDISILSIAQCFVFISPVILLTILVYELILIVWVFILCDQSFKIFCYNNDSHFATPTRVFQSLRPFLSSLPLNLCAYRYNMINHTFVIMSTIYIWIQFMYLYFPIKINTLYLFE